MKKAEIDTWKELVKIVTNGKNSNKKCLTERNDFHKVLRVACTTLESLEIESEGDARVDGHTQVLVSS